MPCSNAAKTQNPLKFVGVPQTPEPISAVSRPKFTILSGHVKEVSIFNSLFPIVNTCLSCEDAARQICAMVPKWRLFASCIFSETHAAPFTHVQRCKVWLTPTTRVPCSNAAKTRKTLKFAGVPQTRQHISAVNKPKFTIIIMRTCGGGIGV